MYWFTVYLLKPTVLALIVCFQTNGQEMWRYSIDQADHEEFTTKQTIDIEYLGSREVQWCYSHGCLVNRSSSPVTTIQCPEAGYHAISPVRNQSLIRYINIVHSPLCYDWYLTLKNTVHGNPQSVLSVWIVDIAHASQEEKNHTAIQPSLFSRRLTKVFHHLGQEPSIRLTSRYSSQFPLILHNRTFNRDLSCWEYTISTSFNHRSVIWISGKSVALYDCFVRSNQMQIMETKFTLSSGTTEDQVKLSGDGQASRVIKDPCAPHVAVFIGSGILFTQDTFRTTTDIFVSESVLQGARPVVADVSFSSSNLLILLTSGKILVYSETESGKVTTASGLSGAVMSRLSRRSECFKGENTKMQSDVLIAWTTQSGTSSVFISNDGGESFQDLDIPRYASSSDWFIHDVILHSFFSSVYFLVNELQNEKQPLILEYQYQQASWQEYSLAFSNFTEASSLAFTFLPASTHLTLIWTSTNVFYGKIEEQGMPALEVKIADHLVLLPTAVNNNITSVTTGGAEDFVILLSNKRMFYGRTGVRYLVEIHPGERPSTDMAVMFDLTDRLVLVKNTSDSFSRRYVPLKNEVMSAVYPNIECPFVKFSTNINPDVLHIDKHETAKVWVSLISRQAFNNSITHEFFGTMSVTMSSTERVEYYPKMVMINKWFIHDVILHSFFSSVYFLVNELQNEKQPLILEYQYQQASWQEYSLAFSNFTEASSLAFTFLPASTHLTLIWTSTNVFYGKIEEQGMPALEVKIADHLVLLPTAVNNNITSVTTGGAEDFVILLSNKRMFYGRTGVRYLVEIHPGERPSTDMAVMFDLTDRLVLVKNTSDSFSRRYVPLKNEVMSAVYPNIECPFVKFSTNINPDVLHIDKHETAKVWVSLISRQAFNNSITHEFFGTMSVTMSSTERVEYYPKMVMINKTFTLSQDKGNQSNTGNRTYGSGPLSIVFHPKEVGVTCKDPYQSTMLIHVGCRPSRHLRIRNCSLPLRNTNISENAQTNYKDVVQCPLSVSVEEFLILVVDVYDGDQFLHEVTSNYVLWEESEQQSYRYSATMDQAGCVREAQTWTKLTTATTSHKNVSWNQDNYQSCYESDGQPVSFDGTQPYQVLNSTGVSHVVFSQHGQYVFTLRELDSRLSFCMLTARFAVNVALGEPKKDFLPEAISMCIVIVICVVLLCTSFLFYRHDTLSEHEQDRQLVERLQQLRVIYKSARLSIADGDSRLPHGARTSTGGMRHSIRRVTGTAEMLALAPKRSSRTNKQSTGDTNSKQEDTIEGLETVQER